MEWLWIMTGILLCIAGILGSVIPILPGPPLNYIALLLLHFTNTHRFTERFIITWLIITLIILILDYMIPIWGAKLSGGTRTGIWGATIGLIAGLLFFPPLGIIIGPFIGAVIGEIIAGKNMDIAIRSGTGTFIGFLAGTIAKLVVAIIMTVYFIMAVV